MARTCKAPNCGTRYEMTKRAPAFRKWCSPECGVIIAKIENEKKKQKAIKAKATKEKKYWQEWNRETKRRKVAIKTKSDFEEDLQKVFNKYIRLRDRHERCISCNRTNAEVMSTDGWKTGGIWDCGHFYGVGAYPELRYCEDNAYKQCKSCNGGSGQYANPNRTISEQYRYYLVKRVGQDMVDWLDGPHEALNYIIDDLKVLIAKYKKVNKEIEREIANEYHPA